MSFPLYFDEHVPRVLAAMLIAAGHDVLTTQQAGNRGADDESQLEFATSVRRAMYTHDVGDFYEIAEAWAASGRGHCGIVIGGNFPLPVLRDRILVLFDLYPDGIDGLTLHLPPLPANR